MTKIPSDQPKDRRKVAVIGSGLAGLTTAYLLRQEGVEVWLIERSDKLGFHSASVSIPCGNGDKPLAANTGARKRGASLNATRRASELAGPQSHVLQKVEEEPAWAGDAVGAGDEWVVDVPMRSFQGGYYPLLISLYHHLGLPLIPCNFTFSFSRIIQSDRQKTKKIASSKSSSPKQQSVGAPSTQTYFLHSGSSGLALPSIPSAAFASLLSLMRHTLHFVVTAACYVIYLALCFLVYHSILSRSRPFSSYITAISRRLDYPIPLLPLPSTRLGSTWQSFAHDIVLPLFSAVGTMSAADVLSMPMGTMADYVHATVGTTHWRLSADTGAREVARRLVKVIKEQGEGYVRMGAEVEGLRVGKGGKGVSVILKDGDIQVDTVVLATPASVAEKLLGGLLDDVAQGGVPKELKREVERLSKARHALSQVREAQTIVVTHRDTSILPSSAHDIRDIDLLQPVRPTSAPTSSSSNSLKMGAGTSHIYNDCFPSEPSDLEETFTSGTHLVRPPAHFASQAPVLQTTNPIVPIDARHVLATARMRRALPISDPQILTDLSYPSPTPNDTSAPAPLVLLAGAYAYPGIPLLEGCVGSALRATRTIVESIESIDEQGASKQRRIQDKRVGGVDWTTGLGGKWGRWWRARRSVVGEVF